MNFKVRQDLPILPAEQSVGWKVTCYAGSEVFLLDAEGKPVETPLTDLDALQEGVQVLAPTLVGHVLATVRKEDGELYWESQGSVGNLIFGDDDRNCWVSTYAINKKVLGKAKAT